MSKRKARIRRGLKTKALIRLSGRMRLVVSRSSANIYAQIVTPNPLGDKVLASSSTIDKELQKELSGKSKVDQAKMVGKLLGERAIKLGFSDVAFDRSGYNYHGRIKALAEGAREAGLNF
jgi:large subunit ribosomal protein L18